MNITKYIFCPLSYERNYALFIFIEIDAIHTSLNNSQAVHHNHQSEDLSEKSYNTHHCTAFKFTLTIFDR